MDQLRTVESSVAAIELQIVSDPPDTSDQLLELRELQRMYRELGVSIKSALCFFE
jgi:hypothetical protein